MYTTYRQRRKDLANLYWIREVSESLHLLEDSVIDASDDPEVYAKILALRSQEKALIQSAISDIPWICRIFPIK